MKKRLAVVVKTTFKVLAIALITLSLFEICYRANIIDFYRFSWTALNTREDLDKKQVDLLVFGDSFSARMNGYVSMLGKHFPGKTILNASVSGIGPRQVNVFATERIGQVQPKAILYQVYVGNDLLDMENLSNWKHLSLSRNIYWALSDYFISLRYLNQRLVVLRKDQSLQSLGLDKPFSANLYDQRTCLCLKADTAYLYKNVALTGDFSNRYIAWKAEVEAFLEKVPATTKVYMLFIPHSAQLNQFYLGNMQSLGAGFADTSVFSSETYPFINRAIQDMKAHPNLVWLNPLQYLREKDRPGYRLYYENDPHFNSNGDAELANYLGQELFR